MADDVSILEWVFGGFAAATLGVAGYFVSALNKNSDSVTKTSDELSAHKTLVAEKYMTIDAFREASNGFNNNFSRLEKRIEDGNNANLASNEKIRAEISAGQNTLVTMISSGNKISAEMNSGHAAIIAAISGIKAS